MNVPQTPSVPFPLRTSTTRDVCAWLEHWHREHLINLDKTLNGIVIWDGHWIYEKSREQLISDLVYLNHPLSPKMIVDTILRERKNEKVMWRLYFVRNRILVLCYSVAIVCVSVFISLYLGRGRALALA
ncbi:hypothetical protein V8E51_006551 [Hyaloscypha variabilis]